MRRSERRPRHWSSSVESDDGVDDASMSDTVSSLGASSKAPKSSSSSSSSTSSWEPLSSLMLLLLLLLLRWFSPVGAIVSA
jgi:hypothetical protein